MNINIYNPYVRAELYHHGIFGQRWGKRNGPPYPLSAGAHSASEKKAGWRKSLAEKREAKAAAKRERKIAYYNKLYEEQKAKAPKDNTVLKDELKKYMAEEFGDWDKYANDDVKYAKTTPISKRTAHQKAILTPEGQKKHSKYLRDYEEANFYVESRGADYAMYDGFEDELEKKWTESKRSRADWENYVKRFK